MRTGFFAFITGKKQKAVNDSAPSFGKQVLEAVKNSKGTTEEEIAGEMKGVLDSMAILKDCEAKTKLVDVVRDCFDNKSMTVENADEVTATLDSMWIDIHGDSLSEIAKAFSKLGAKPTAPSAPAEDTAVNKDSEDEPKEDKDKDSADKPKEDKNKDSEDKSDKDDKDGCSASKDSAEVIASVMDSLKSEIKTLVAESVKECLGIKEDTPKATGGVVDTAFKGNEGSGRDYTSFLE